MDRTYEGWIHAQGHQGRGPRRGKKKNLHSTFNFSWPDYVLFELTPVLSVGDSPEGP